MDWIPAVGLNMVLKQCSFAKLHRVHEKLFNNMIQILIDDDQHIFNYLHLYAKLLSISQNDALETQVWESSCWSSNKQNMHEQNTMILYAKFSDPFFKLQRANRRHFGGYKHTSINWWIRENHAPTLTNIVLIVHELIIHQPAYQHWKPV